MQKPQRELEDFTHEILHNYYYTVSVKHMPVLGDWHGRDSLFRRHCQRKGKANSCRILQEQICFRKMCKREIFKKLCYKNEVSSKDAAMGKISQNFPTILCQVEGVRVFLSNS